MRIDEYLIERKLTILLCKHIVMNIKYLNYIQLIQLRLTWAIVEGQFYNMHERKIMMGIIQF